MTGVQTCALPICGWAKCLPVRFRVRKVRNGLKRAIATSRVFHLWTHPFNLASDPDRLLAGIEQIFRDVADMRERGEIENLTMRQVVERITV